MSTGNTRIFTRPTQSHPPSPNLKIGMVSPDERFAILDIGYEWRRIDGLTGSTAKRIQALNDVGWARQKAAGLPSCRPNERWNCGGI